MTEDDSNEDDDWAFINVRMKENELNRFDAQTDNRSGRMRKIIKAWNDIYEDESYDNDFEHLNEVMLRTYLNAIRKNISVLKQQEEELEEHLEELEEDEHGDALVEINIEPVKRSF